VLKMWLFYQAWCYMVFMNPMIHSKSLNLNKLRE
jgi:hypothetical protein